MTVMTVEHFSNVSHCYDSPAARLKETFELSKIWKQ
ncbi:hypothetical protein U14_05374 [Candidatus Moduliflexus flocculans]|uniref:Uncharacterized protein n=1 Tax=Candidatus Moduliflexus flocculans TaxID=1499966 RepID=A0A081BRR6_9BACT|nr:hypothetical protein U14_05374 [Candidatus Moduliflexus flocculans]